MISVIIRNKNEGRFIGYAIQSVIDNLDNYEIIVVDNNSTDSSIDIVKSFNFENIKIVKINDYMPGRALNLGIEKAAGDIILILSAHSQIIKMISEQEIRCHIKKHPCLFGNQIPVYRGKKISKRYIWSHFNDNENVENMFSNIENRYFFHNAFSIFEKKLLVENKFDETLSGKEDRYWVKSVIEKGYKSLYIFNMKCIHHWTKNGNTWKGL
jgi:rhamnosyltransferase